MMKRTKDKKIAANWAMSDGLYYGWSNGYYWIGTLDQLAAIGVVHAEQH